MFNQSELCWKPSPRSDSLESDACASSFSAKKCNILRVSQHGTSNCQCLSDQAQADALGLVSNQWSSPNRISRDSNLAFHHRNVLVSSLSRSCARAWKRPSAPRQPVRWGSRLFWHVCQLQYESFRNPPTCSGPVVFDVPWYPCDRVSKPQCPL